MKKLILILGCFTLLSVSVFSQTTYDENRIKEVFKNYETQNNDNNFFVVGHKPFIALTFSKYINETQKEAIERIHKREINQSSGKFLGEKKLKNGLLKEYFVYPETPECFVTWMFFKDFKVAFFYEGSKEDFPITSEKILAMIDEATDTNKKIINRPYKSPPERKKVTDFFDLDILKKYFNDKEFPNFQEFYLKDNEYIFDEIIFEIQSRYKNTGLNAFTDVKIYSNGEYTKDEIEDRYIRISEAIKKNGGTYEELNWHDLFKKDFGESTWVHYSTNKMSGIIPGVQMITMYAITITDNYTIEIKKSFPKSDKTVEEFQKQYKDYMKKIAKALKK